MTKNTFGTERFLTHDRKTFIIKLGQFKPMLPNKQESGNSKL